MPWPRCRSHASAALRIPLVGVVGAMCDPLGVVDAVADVSDARALNRQRL